MTRSVAVAVLAVCCAAGDSSLLFAQAPASNRPYRALFGRGSQGTEGQSLELSATLMQAYDDNLLAESGSITPGAATVSGQYTMFQAGGAYGWATRRVQLGITGNSAFRYYSQLSHVQSVSQSVGIGLSTTLPKRTGLAINQSAAYSPSYLSGLFPSLGAPRLGDALPANPNYTVEDEASFAYATAAAITHGVTRRGTIRAAADYTFTDFRGATNRRPDGSAYGARADFSRQIGRHSGMTLGYRYRTGDFGLTSGEKSTEHGVDLSFDHTQVLSATRRAQYSFSVGASGTTVPSSLVVGASVTPLPISIPTERLYRVVGSGAVLYQFSRTGEFGASYRRGVDYIIELAQPVLTDGVSVSASNAVTSRLTLTTGAGYSNGAAALGQTSTFKTYTADVASHFALTRTLGAYLEYLYYFYDFGSDRLLAPGLPRRLERNGVRAGLTVSTPLLRR